MFSYDDSGSLIIVGSADAFIADDGSCISLGVLRYRKIPLPVPTMLRQWGIPSISRSIGTLFLVFDVSEYFRLRRLPRLLSIQVVVLGSLLRRPRFLCTVEVMWRGIRCESSKFPAVSIGTLLDLSPS